MKNTIEPANMVEGEQYYIEKRLWPGERRQPNNHTRKLGTFRFANNPYSAVFDNVTNIDDGSVHTDGELFSTSGYKFYKMPSRYLKQYQRDTYEKWMNQGLKDQGTVSDIGKINQEFLGGKRKSYRRRKSCRRKSCRRKRRK